MKDKGRSYVWPEPPSLFDPRDSKEWRMYEERSKSFGRMLEADGKEPLKPCPCCGIGLVAEGHWNNVCGVCGWEDSRYQFEHPDCRDWANEMSLNEARAAYKKEPKTACKTP